MQPQPQYQAHAQPQAQVMTGQPVVMGAQPGMMAAAFPATSATAALVLSILGLVMCGCFTAIPGVIMAKQALEITNQFPGHPDHSTANIAHILGWIVIALGLIVAFIYIMLIGMAGASGGY